MHGVVELDLSGNLVATDVNKLDEDSPLLHGMVSCHSLTLIKDKIEGDPLDVKVGTEGYEFRHNECGNVAFVVSRTATGLKTLFGRHNKF